jgi:hypothetical protein
MLYDAGRPRAVIRFRIPLPRTASLRRPAGLRGRRPSLTIDLYRKTVLHRPGRVPRWSGPQRSRSANAHPCPSSKSLTPTLTPKRLDSSGSQRTRWTQTANESNRARLHGTPWTALIRFRNQQVGGSNPLAGSNQINHLQRVADWPVAIWLPHGYQRARIRQPWLGYCHVDEQSAHRPPRP